MPSIAMCSVRGIGVAVIVNTGTSFLSFLIRSLSTTPNRCSSSITQQAQPRKLHVARQQAMRPDDDVDFAARGVRDHRPRFSLWLRNRETISTRTG